MNTSPECKMRTDLLYVMYTFGMEPEEMVDIVDEHNQVIGTASKTEAHAKGLLHRTVIAEVHNSKGEWLLVKQAGHKQDAGQYVSPVGGHVKAGETEIEALQRETEEEVGLKNVRYEKVGQFIYDRSVKDHRENHFFLVYIIHSDDDLDLNDESVGYERFTEAELKEKLISSPEQFGGAFHIVVNTLFKHLLL